MIAISKTTDVVAMAYCPMVQELVVPQEGKI